MKSKLGYSIKDIEQLTGIKAHTIRIWEKRYNIVKPKRTHSNIRYYDDDDLKRLLVISMLNKHGNKISVLAKLSNDELNEKLNFISSNSTDFQNQINSLLLLVNQLDQVGIEHQINNFILQHGFEITIKDIIFPLLNKIGILWQTGALSPVEEHFVSNIIRQKLIVAIDNEVIREHKTDRRFLLFSPKDELHELPILFTLYLLKKKSIQNVYLGVNTPIESVIKLVEKRNFTDIVISTIIKRPENVWNTFVDKVIELSKKYKIHLLIHNNDNEFPDVENIYLHKNIESFKNNISL